MRKKSTRPTVTSTARYSAIPPHTPATIRFVVLRSSRALGIGSLLPCAVLVRDGEHDRGEGRDRNGGLLHRSDRSLERNGDPRDQGDRRGEGVARDGRRERRDRDRAGSEQSRGRQAGEQRGCERSEPERTVLGARGDGRDVEPGWELTRLEAQRAAQQRLVEEVVVRTHTAHPVASSSRRRSARPRSSCTPTVEAGLPLTCAISPRVRSLKKRSTKTTRDNSRKGAPAAPDPGPASRAIDSPTRAGPGAGKPP